MKNKFLFLLTTLFLSSFLQSQATWSLGLSSVVEKDGRGLGGANIELLQGNNTVKKSVSAGNGYFSIDVPGNGEYLLKISYQDCNSKTFLIKTTGVPQDILERDHNRPTMKIDGVTMKKPLYSINYSALKMPMAKILYVDEDKKFGHDERHTDKMLDALDEIREAERALLEKHASTIKDGDIALKKKHCPLAKKNYEAAITLIPEPPYDEEPKLKLSQADKCIQEAESAEAVKIKQEQEALKRSESEKLAKEQAAKEKTEADKLAAGKAIKDKEEKEKIARQKSETEKLAREKASAEKTEKLKQESDRLAREKTIKDESDRVVKERNESDKIAREKQSEAEKAKADKKRSEEKLIAAEKIREEQAKKEKKATDEREKMARDKAAKASSNKTLSTVSTSAGSKKPSAKAPPDNQKKDPQEELVTEETVLRQQSSSSKKKSTSSRPQSVAKENEKTDRKKRSGNAQSIPVVLGASDKYREAVKEGDGYFTMKRWVEAIKSYEEALLYKKEDPYATRKISEIKKILK